MFSPLRKCRKQSKYRSATIQSTQKTVVVPRVQFIDKLVDDPTVMQRQLPTFQGVQHYMQHDKEVDVRAFMLDADELCQSAIGQDDSDELNEAADEVQLEHENDKRSLSKRTETVLNESTEG